MKTKQLTADEALAHIKAGKRVRLGRETFGKWLFDMDGEVYVGRQMPNNFVARMSGIAFVSAYSDCDRAAYYPRFSVVRERAKAAKP
jgi:hypothetical protein